MLRKGEDREENENKIATRGKNGLYYMSLHPRTTTRLVVPCGRDIGAGLLRGRGRVQSPVLHGALHCTVCSQMRKKKPLNGGILY